MSVYIKGMGMPTSCSFCRFSGFGGLRNERVVCMFTGANAYMNTVQYLDDCPLVPVPEHGRLIDADALTTQMERNLWAIEDKAEKELGFNETLRRGMQYGHAVCVDAVNAAPTIIPADEETEK